MHSNHIPDPQRLDYYFCLKWLNMMYLLLTGGLSMVAIPRRRQKVSGDDTMVTSIATCQSKPSPILITDHQGDVLKTWEVIRHRVPCPRACLPHHCFLGSPILKGRTGINITYVQSSRGQRNPTHMPKAAPKLTRPLRPSDGYWLFWTAYDVMEMKRRRYF